QNQSRRLTDQQRNEWRRREDQSWRTRQNEFRRGEDLRQRLWSEHERRLQEQRRMNQWRFQQRYWERLRQDQLRLQSFTYYDYGAAMMTATTAARSTASTRMGRTAFLATC